MLDQDGTIGDAVSFWRANVDREFDGAEPCAICYCVVEARAHTLPTAKCATCGTGFHRRCLLKVR